MDTVDHTTSHDPLGLKRFALTESAYDLVNSIRGTYGRMSYAESQKENPDKNLMDQWRKRSKEIGREYRDLNIVDLSIAEEFIKTATDEWRQITELENERVLLPSHAS